MRTLPLLLTTLFVLAPQKSAQADDKTKPSPQLAKTKVEAAQKVYEQFWRDGCDVETHYRWSRRWLEAVRESGEKDSVRKAIEAHLDRLKQMELRLQKLLVTGSGSWADLAVAAYYRVEGEIWLDQAKRK